MVKFKVKKLRTLAEKSAGLIGIKKAYPVSFTTRWGIHTFGVLFPIDVLILNKNNRVVGMRRRLQKNRLFFWNPIHERVIELPSGTIEKKKITFGTPITLHITQ